MPGVDDGSAAGASRRRPLIPSLTMTDRVEELPFGLGDGRLQVVDRREHTLVDLLVALTSLGTRAVRSGRVPGATERAAQRLVHAPELLLALLDRTFPVLRLLGHE